MAHSVELESGIDERRSWLYDNVLKRILGETYQEELIELFRQRGFITDGCLPSLCLPADRHEGSNARYLFDFYHRDDRILVPIMGPWKKTTQHFHRSPIIETYEILKGKLYLSLNGSSSILIPPEGLTVSAGDVHQAETRDQYALTLIVMKNAKLVPHDQQHIHI